MVAFVLGAVLFSGAVLFYVLQPLFTGRSAPLGPDDEEMTDAEALRRVSLLALRDVEYDRETGKLDDHDYATLKRELSAEAIAAIEAERRERLLDATRKAAGPIGLRPIVVDVEAELDRVRRGLRSGLTCRECGHVAPEGSRFCSQCGHALARAAAGSGTAS
jgi:hypothetical protein